MKRSLPKKTKVGHTGTLDPLASGLLVVMIGRATRLSRYISDLEKTYTATARFGATSDSLDADGEIEDLGGPMPDEEEMRAALPEFTGETRQIPPMASALKVGGRRLYDLHRRGETIEREARTVTVHEFELMDANPAEKTATFRVRCGGGTYVRSLVSDLAASLGTGAYLTALRREAVGDFSVEGAARADEISEDGIASRLLPPVAAVSRLPAVVISPEVARRAVRNGAALGPSGHEGSVAVVCEGRLLAVYRDDGERARPEVVLCAGS